MFLLLAPFGLQTFLQLVAQVQLVMMTLGLEALALLRDIHGQLPQGSRRIFGERLFVVFRLIFGF